MCKPKVAYDKTNYFLYKCTWCHLNEWWCGKECGSVVV